MIALLPAIANGEDGATGRDVMQAGSDISANQSLLLEETRSEQPSREAVEGVSSAPVISEGARDLPEFDSVEAIHAPSKASEGGLTIPLRRGRSDRMRNDASSVASPTGVTPWYRTSWGALGIVLAVITATFWTIKRFTPSARISDNGVLRVVGRCGLTPKHNLVLVRLGSRFILVGISPDGIHGLCNVAGSNEADLLAASMSGKSAKNPGAFSELLGRESMLFRSEERGDSTSLAETSEETTTWERMSPPTTNRPVAKLIQRLRALQS